MRTLLVTLAMMAGRSACNLAKVEIQIGEGAPELVMWLKIVGVTIAITVVYHLIRCALPPRAEGKWIIEKEYAEEPEELVCKEQPT